LQSSPKIRLTASPTLADQAYVVLRRAISEGEFEAGQRVTERGLAEQLGVSPTPVREAIRRLEHERLLERLDGRALSVAQPTTHRLFELNLIEAALAGVAAGLAAESATDSEIATIWQVHDQAKMAAATAKTVDEGIAALRLARHMHESVYQASHNTQLVEMIATVGVFDWQIRTESVRRLGPTYPAGAALDDHACIIDAIEARDPVLADSLMRYHVAAAAHRHLDVVAAHSTPRVPGQLTE
jgi:DNA-binding GntR family transcriptional regulator